ncbi:Small GTPase superfamily ARF/SAR type [Carpediemonas membranifera]|uniref:Small GTPase superfamily ARF/SAR type n=1 Tax=Carpediemonas membranifera TaxID=201153 RepID=A0A8J6ATR8_9EUKA|nr:Small GTPase superfamily ARF/SAR type [Carpediemonas membranifera]|eukprot:KAG9392210.1 Small GTPase superfamily ARF/SAR type [Carpediemonas membranifera]
MFAKRDLILHRGDRTMHAPFFGANTVGKTTLVNRLVGTIDELTTIPTLTFNVETIKFGGPGSGFPRSKITIWDLGGAYKFHELHYHYLNEKMAVMCLITNPHEKDSWRLDKQREYLHRILDHDTKTRPLIVVANYHTDDWADCPDAMTPDGLADELGLFNLADRMWTVIPCNAVSGKNVGALLPLIARVSAAEGARGTTQPSVAPELQPDAVPSNGAK